ncbi:MAG: mercury(II) reductase [Chloroflexi bacterium]|nr:mercury(II) reductase [Chloroflexota bacterium]
MMKKLELDVRGMTCDTCPQHVENALLSVSGVQKVLIPGWQSTKAIVTVESGVKGEDLIAAVKRSGYSAFVNAESALDNRFDDNANGSEGGQDFDLLIIGAGSGGFAAAIKAVDLGFKVGLVGYGELGGTCVNVGCIPSKTLIRAAEAWHNAGNHPFNGVYTHQDRIDWEAIRNEKDNLVSSMRQSKYIDVLAAYPEITYLEGQATFQGNGSIAINNLYYTANRYIIATGAKPRMIAYPGIEGAEPLNSTTLMDLEKLPKSLIILGGRAIALELGQTMARLGVEVLILQRSTRLVPEHEPVIGRKIKEFLEMEGVGIITGVQIDRLSRKGDTRIVHTRVMGQDREFSADQILMALGREPNTDGIGLENVGVDVDENGAIVVNETMQTTNSRIYATGDVTSYPEYVYVAAAGGIAAAQNALTDDQKPLDLTAMPSVIFTDPQIATVGMTEAEARQAGYKVKVSTVNLEHLARAQAARDIRGFIKLVADEATNRLLGAHVLAAEAGEVIQTATLAIKFGLKLEDLTGTMFPYLTQVEGLKLAALGFEKDIALLSCCAG